MIKPVEMYTVICDGCQADAGDHADHYCWSEGRFAREQAAYAYWELIDGKDYCPKCYELNEETDEYRPKEQK